MSKEKEKEESKEESKGSKEAKKEEKKTCRAYSRYIQDPVFIGLIVLAILLAMMTVAFAMRAPACGATAPVDNVVVNGTPVVNNTPSTGKLQIYVFSEFLCPYCGAAAGKNQAVMDKLKSGSPGWEPAVPKIQEVYGDKVDVVFKHYIVHGANAQKASEASECARDQGKFWEMHDKMFSNQGALALDNLKAYATELGLDATKFNACLDNGDKTAVVNADTAMGKQLGVTGTPTFFIGGADGFKIVGAQPYSNFKPLVDKALAGEKPAPEPAPAPEPVVDMAKLVGTAPSEGSATAPVTIVMFSEFMCPYCTRFEKDTKPQLLTNYINTGKVKLVYRAFLIHGAPAQLLHEASYCADEQGKFWEFHAAYIAGGVQANATALKQVAVTLGLDATKFGTCLDTKKYASKVTQDMADGREAGVSGTPTFFINGKKIVGAQPYDAFKTAIDAAIADAS